MCSSTAQKRQTFYERRLKRPLDIALTLIALALFWPLIIVIAASVLIFVGRPILYVDRRAGWYGAGFGCLKFRTMTGAVDANGDLLPDEDRMTPVGRFLRATSLDELPQLWNVLRGEMSLVGPRPLTVRYLDLYSPEQARRHEVRPGITGWAQVNGRNGLSWDKKFELDTWYVDHISWQLDVRILVRTIGCVMRQRGVSAEGRVTMSAFVGSDST